MKPLKETLEISELMLVKTSDVVTQKASLFQISPRGFYIRIHRKDILNHLRFHLTLRSLCHKDVHIHLPQFHLGLDGVIKKTRHIGQGIFEVFIEFFENVPTYWNQCLLDMILSYPDGSFSDEFDLSLKKMDQK